VLYDGVCVFCDATVRLLYDLDSRRSLSFATLQGRLGAGLAKAHPRELSGVDSIVFVTGVGTGSERIEIRSAAILSILQSLGGAWNLVAVLRLVPAAVRDRLYDWFAKRRYRWFGKKNIEACMIPGPEDEGRFFD
jgi:predicted DCC family thiol-disulfide oxidoreductase YuxK